MTNLRHIFLTSVLFCGLLLTLHCGNSSPSAQSAERGLPSAASRTPDVVAENAIAPVLPTTSTSTASNEDEAASASNPPEAATTAAGASAARAVARVASEVDGLSVRRLVVSEDIENREPVGAASRFDRETDRLFAFVEAVNESDEAGELVVTFESEDGTEVGFITLEIPANARRWRTWAWSQNIHEVGSWTAVIRTADGDELAREHFEIES